MSVSELRASSRLLLVVALIFLAVSLPCRANDSVDNGSVDRGLFRTVFDDYRSFYSLGRLARVGIVYTAAFGLTHTDLDPEIRESYQEDYRSESTDDWSDDFENLGQGFVMVPAAFLLAGLDLVVDDNPVGDWGINMSRAYLVGVPFTLLTKRATGGSRPGEGEDESEWAPFDDSNGVSGHAFVGAVPFMTIGRMNAENPFIKYPMYLLSMLPALSRINDDKHYFTQVALGWYNAFESVDAVFDSNDRHARGLQLNAVPMGDSLGLQASWQW